MPIDRKSKDVSVFQQLLSGFESQNRTPEGVGEISLEMIG